ncbi:hypothetical protein Rsub_10895 [Raphidocelis subcapitata]|uniref:Uncharacterized protein n=1 Tax=Raphidocelis subcapitata TaxID=307507 RepID=A0A2V0PD06_9CHLO|nr:hypothetical protein Rsub_10895 [Raphidocelis subcapitata]|eukprot:GBF97731.1 hypothetical protein Rsub_10895 [Raphidocelis subcapitata]
MRDFVPISHTYPAAKPLLEDNGKRKLRGAAGDDLRVQTLKQQQQQQSQPPPAKRACAGGAQPQQPPPKAAAGAATASGDSQLGGVFHQRSMEGTEVTPPGGAAAPASGATDFSAFLETVRLERRQGQGQGQEQEQEEQQQGASQRQASQRQGQGQGQQRPPRPQVALTTFDHLTSNQLPADQSDHLAQLQSIKSLYDFRADASRDAAASNGPWPARGGSLASFHSGGSDAAAGTASAAAAAAAAAGAPQYELSGLHSAPWDWSLKTRVRVASPRPLACLSASAAAGLLPACRAACGGGGGGGAAAAGAAALAERLQRALLQWQHPAERLGADALAVMRTSKLTAELLSARARAWRDVLRGLVAAVRNGQCPAAYCAGAQLFHQPLTVLFLAPGVMDIGCSGGSGGGEPAAIVSRSNRQLRQALDAAGARYAMASARDVGGGKAAAAAAAAGPQPLGQAPSAADGRAGSQLLVLGGRGVQALHLLLLQQPWCAGEGGGDVPTLLAPTPFPGGALCPCALRELPGAPAALARRAPGGLQQQQQHYSELLPGGGAASSGGDGGIGGGGPSSGGPGGGGGLVAPWTLARLASLLAESEGEFEVFTDAEATSGSCNPAPDLAAPWAAEAAQGEGGGGALSCQERAGFGPSSARLAGRFVRQLRFSGGAFSARLAAP